jgi:galactose oxidase
MANLGNAWHIPTNTEPRGSAGMRDPVFPTTPGQQVTIVTGNQYQGGGNPGNQLQDGSELFYKRTVDTTWTQVPMLFSTAAGNNKYYSGAIPLGAFSAGDQVQYYLRLPYDDHDTTYLRASSDQTASVTTAAEDDARSAPFTFIVETADVRGQWGPVFALPNVAIHAHLLANGLVLMWGRRDDPGQSLDVDPPSSLAPWLPPAPPARCTPFLWDPTTGRVTTTPLPTLGPASTTNANLFCSGHSFLADGRLLVVGGHLADQKGLALATIYDSATNTWTPQPAMNNGRWYPTTTTMPGGGVVVLSGSYLDQARGAFANNTVPELWSGTGWQELMQIPEGVFDLYPRLHVASNGVVFLTGSLAQTWSLDVANGGHWTKVAGAQRDNAVRDYAPSVMYDVDKVIYIGGGNPPTANAELIDLGAAQPGWTPTAAMHLPRRQHNATVLPDGTVLVTGGTSGQGFNALDPGQPAHIAELWDPATGQWTQLAAEQVDRCYHATAVLLPDATVLSAGGGEFFPVEGIQMQNDPQDTHRDAQVFSPPYLFKGARPQITSAPTSVHYGETFQIDTPQAGEIGKVSWIGLSSVTHAFNTGQRLTFLSFQAGAAGLTVTAPGSANACPPGPHMLFILDRRGVPSVAKIISIGQPAPASALHANVATPHPEGITTLAAARPAPLDAFAQQAAVHDAAQGTRVLVGITGICPYGISACWGGANEGLRSLEGVQFVDPIPDGATSTATVFLDDDRLPALDRWDEQFRRVVNASYVLRGVEVSIAGEIGTRDGALVIGPDGNRPGVVLAPLGPAGKIQWDRAAAAPEAVAADEAAAYERLAAHAAGSAPGQPVTVTGPLTLGDDGYRLEVRLLTT